MSCKDKLTAEIAKILSDAIIRRNFEQKIQTTKLFEKTLASEGKLSDNCKKNKRLSKKYVK